MKQTTKAEIAKNADETRTLTLEEAKALPGMLGMIAFHTLKAKGSYGYVDGAGRKILLRVA